VSGAVEETLRYDALVQMTSRLARQDGHIGTTPVRDGDTVVLLLGVGNRDPEAFDAPDEFDIRRSSGAQHLTFSAGPHFRLGAGLARLEARVVFELFVTRVVASALATDGLAYKPNLTLRGPDRLTIDFHDIRRPL
jgi:hypothetical protein